MQVGFLSLPQLHLADLPIHSLGNYLDFECSKRHIKHIVTQVRTMKLTLP